METNSARGECQRDGKKKKAAVDQVMSRQGVNITSGVHTHC